TRKEGYKGCCAAVSGTGFFASTAALRIPTLGLAGSDDSATPPDLVRETTDLVPGSQFHLFRGAGHLPCAEQPEQYAKVLGQFLRNIGHI
ncbi:MAG: 3-oxoadipate enol-lactonase, partial [Rhodobacteraceae bacterium]|nr:3-oxoadipate enol-lactonase [Paracoccaceae bacterium]